MILKSQDILVLLKLISKGNARWTYAMLSVELGMSPSEVHAAIKRSLKAQLAFQYNSRIMPNTHNLGEFIAHGIRYVFIPDRGEITRGMPTVFAASPLKEQLVASGDPPLVWPDSQGELRGQSFSPLYKSVPFAAGKDGNLYELLVLVDAIRGGNARERNIALPALFKKFDSFHAHTKSEY